MPTAISTIFGTSPSPSAMNRIGRTAIGGITAMIVMIGPGAARTSGTTPSAMPMISVESVAMAMAMPSRHRLAAVSASAVTCPVRGSVSVKRRSAARTIATKVGRTLSLGLASALGGGQHRVDHEGDDNRNGPDQDARTLGWLDVDEPHGDRGALSLLVTVSSASRKGGAPPQARRGLRYWIRTRLSAKPRPSRG